MTEEIERAESVIAKLNDSLSLNTSRYWPKPYQYLLSPKREKWRMPRARTGSNCNS
jgi:hypothetical protein